MIVIVVCTCDIVNYFEIIIFILLLHSDPPGSEHRFNEVYTSSVVLLL